MPVYTPSRVFEGSESNPFGRIVKEGIRTVSFRDDKNKEGNFFFILPPYKLDRAGNAVSWKVINVRTDFGIDPKERFVEAPDCPIKFFANRVKMLFPEYAKIETVKENGQDRKKYPTYGRIQKQNVFNVAYCKQLELGAHVLNIPQWGAGSVIEDWSRTKGVDGKDRPMLNDPKAAYPVWFQLKKNLPPWVVTVESSKAYGLPESLADSDYLYNLDEVLYYPDKEELVEKLRSITPAEIFNVCMEDYFRGSTPMKVANVGIPTEAPAQVEVAMAAPAVVNAPKIVVPTATIPKANIPTANIPTAQAEASPQATVSSSGNPVAMTHEAAKRFLNKPI